ncbi:probable Rho GTPase-activating protein CG5521 isoform X2 [Drosophila grimshawi]|uniref:GH18626 n=1 Tax=Drosophila grimshawi TaxID=7222 RepID=B4JHI1_DROGR|nr:probable Rho GTPase-activating protein CG5521 isoform X2 [Drosophila grimshawi]EDV92808.1 GH18626 [Drosophila grimshawi]
MFTKKSHADVKKSTAKLQDCKKDSASRLRHLRTILDNVDYEESKSLFETNYSHVYFILYDTFIQAEANLKQKVHKAHREELDGSLWLLEKILCLLPELLARRWQCHSLSRIMAKLLHLGNSPKLRREGVKYFLLWYQTLGDNAPSYVHAMYADLIPGLIVPQKGGVVGPDTEFSATDFLSHPNMKADGGMASVFHDNAFSHPVQSSEVVALLPPSSSEKSAPPDPRDGLEVLLNSMVQTAACLRWRDNRAQKDHRAFAFLLQRFKDVFLPVFSPSFDASTSIYNPRLEMPVMRSIHKKEEVMASCVVVLINWVSRFTHERLLSNRLDCALHIEGVDHARLLGYQQGLIVRDVFYVSRENINFVHEVYRQAFLLNFTSKTQIEAIRTAIAVYRDWMTGSTPPPFLLEPNDEQYSPLTTTNATSNAGGTPRSQRLRTPSYVGAMHQGGTKEQQQMVRAGMQNVLQVFVTNAANVFLVNTANLNICFNTRSRDYRSTPLEEQTEICKKVLNVYRTMVMNTRMETRTWEQMLLVLLQVTSIVLHQNPPASGAKSANLGYILGSAIIQTLIVTWIRAHTNVPVNVVLWEKFLVVLQSLTHREELIVEWNKTIQTLTRVFSRYTYGINLLDLPLDRVAETRGKRRRIGSVWQGSATGANNSNANATNTAGNNVHRERESIAESNSSRSDENSHSGGSNSQAPLLQANSHRSHHQHSQSHGGVIGHGTRPVPLTPMLSRSYSEGSLASAARNSRMRRRRATAPKPDATVMTTPISMSGSAAQDLRRAISLDSLAAPVRKTRRRRGSQLAVDDVDGYADAVGDQVDPDNESAGGGSRSPSPTASSGIEGGSIKDAQLHIDVLAADTGSLEDGSSGSFVAGGNYGNSERRSIMLGGTATGWLPDSTSIMWKRMLGALGDVNRIPKSELHAQVFKHLLEMTHNLIKIKQNQGISTDNQSTPPPPALVPPIGVVAPWCYGALTLDRSFKKGKLWALQLLSALALQGAINMQQLPLFYHALHQLLTGEDRDLIYAIMKHLEGPRLLSLLLPGHTLLLLDLVHASAILLTSLEVTRSTPRAEVAALLGSLLSYPAMLLPRPVLQPTPQKFELMECPDLQDHILNIMLRCARREPSAKARCIALCQLGQWLLLRLSQPSSPDKAATAAGQRAPFHQSVPHPKDVPLAKDTANSYHPRIREVLQVLLQALQFKHHTIAVIAVDALKLCAERGRQLAAIERLPQLIITALCKALEIHNVAKLKDADKVVLTSLMLCLGEFCMAIPAAIMLAPYNDQGDTLVLQVLGVLLQVASGAPRHERVKLTADDDFDMHIASDDLQGDGRLPEASYQTLETIQGCISAVRLCARAVAMHLVTHLGHFPMGIGASRLSSMVEEQDDIYSGSIAGSQLQRRDSMELPSVVSAQNMQLFMLNTGLVASFIELPTLKLPGGGITAGLVTAEKQVRVLMRDLNGKACWDASILYSEPRKCEPLASSERYDASARTARSVSHGGMDSMMKGQEVQLHTRHTLRHRPLGVLPLAKDVAPDLDQLDDMLSYIGHTSPECVPPCIAELNAPCASPLSSAQEAQAISVILSQRLLEQEYVAHTAQHALRHAGSSSSLQPDQRSLHSASVSFDSFTGAGAGSLQGRVETPFQYCRLLFAHLGLAGWERRSRTHLLQRSEKLLRELRNVDVQKCRETHKMAVIYVAAGQEDKSSILRNTNGSSMYEMFVSALGWEIELETHNGFLGGLPRQGCGATAPYYATPFLEVVYHVATRMPSDSSEAMLLKTRHLGNDEVHIVWSEHHRDYRRDILPTEFCDVLIVVYPLRNGLFRVTVNRKPEVPWFGPLANESVVSGACLATLIRATAINAGRTKRAALPLYQQFYEERNRSLDSVSTRYKESTTFEDFASRIYNPMPLSTLSTLRESNASSAGAPLAAALIDHNRASVKGWVQASIDATPVLGIAPSASAGSTSAMEANSNSSITSASPRGPRKLGAPFKSVTKKHSLQQIVIGGSSGGSAGGDTPPESPTLPLRRIK